MKYHGVWYTERDEGPDLVFRPMPAEPNQQCIVKFDRVSRVGSILIVILALFLLTLAVGCLIAAGLTADAWNPLSAMPLTAAAYALAFLLLLSFIRRAFRRSMGAPRWLGVAGMMLICLAVGIAQVSSNLLTQQRRESEVRRALDAGLEKDCRSLLTKYRGDPTFQKQGYICLFPGSAEYHTLPRSIRMLNPHYVTLEDRPWMPANIGLCKNGFGGFAFGVRVFMSSKNIPAPYRGEPITPTVYIWEDYT